jgi:MFS family permease
MSTVPASPPLWRNRDYRLLLSGQVVSAIGSQVSQLAFPLLMFAVTHSPVQAGFLGAIRALPYLLFSLPAGALVDRWNRKHTMIVCDAGRGIALGSIPLALALGHLTLAQLYAVSLVEGSLFVFFSLAESACLPRLVPAEQLPTAAAQGQMVDATSTLLGPSLGGALYSLGAALPFVVDAVSYIASVCSLFFVRAAFQEERTAPPGSLWSEIGEGLRWLWRQPVIRFLAVLTGGLNVCCFGYILIIIVLAQRMHASAAVIGLIFAGGGIGSLVGAALASRLERRFGVGPTLVAAAWVWALSWALYAVAPTPLLLGVVNAVSFTIVPVYMSVQYSYRLARTPDALQGRVNSVFRLIAYGNQPLSLALTGALLQAWGPIATILVLTVPQVLLALGATGHKALRSAR